MTTTYPGDLSNVTVKTEGIDQTPVGNMPQQQSGSEAADAATVKEEPEDFSDQSAVEKMNQQQGGLGAFDAVTVKEEPENSDTFKTETEEIDIKEKPRDASLDMTLRSWCTKLEPADVPHEQLVDPVDTSEFNGGPEVQESPSKPQGKSPERKEKEQKDPKPSQWKCVWCDSLFKNKTQLKYHENQEHKGQKRHMCDTCGTAFTRISSLNRHARSHSGLKPYSCDLCDAKFARATYLEVHKRVHSGDKPYACGQCEAMFARATNLQEHRRVHSVERPFCCDFCGATFARSRYLMVHQKRKHVFENP